MDLLLLLASSGTCSFRGVGFKPGIRPGFSDREEGFSVLLECDYSLRKGEFATFREEDSHVICYKAGSTGCYDHCG